MHIDRAHRDAVIGCITKNLRGRVETQRLTVEQRGGERCGMVAFEPRARIDQQREARRVRLGKAVAGESLDLLEDL